MPHTRPSVTTLARRSIAAVAKAHFQHPVGWRGLKQTDGLLIEVRRFASHDACDDAPYETRRPRGLPGDEDGSLHGPRLARKLRAIEFDDGQRRDRPVDGAFLEVTLDLAHLIGAMGEADDRRSFWRRASLRRASGLNTDAAHWLAQDRWPLRFASVFLSCHLAPPAGLPPGHSFMSVATTPPDRRESAPTAAIARLAPKVSAMTPAERAPTA